MKPTKQMPTLVSAGALLIMLSGCASSPWLKDELDTPDYSDPEMSEDQRIRTSFFGRFMADQNTRGEIETEILQTEYVREWSTGEKATNASMAGDVIADEIASDLGLALGITATVFGLLSDDGSMDYISQAFLPATVDGQKIENAKEAKIATNGIIRQRLEVAAQILDADLQCIQGCDQRSDSIFTMKLPAQSPSKDFIYWPPDVVITVDVGGATDVEEGSALGDLIGLPVAWKTLPGNSAEVRLYAEGSYSESGELEFVPNRGNRKIDPMVKRELEGTALGESMLKTIYQDERLVWGTNDAYPGRLFLDGKVYGFVGTGRPDFVKYTVDIPSLEERLN